MITVTLQQPEPTDLDAKVPALALAAKAITIRDVESHGAALAFVKDVTLAIAQVKELFREPKARAHQTHRAVTQAEKKLLDPLEQARQAVGDKCHVWAREQRRLADEARQRQEEQAQKEAEDRKLDQAQRAQDSGMPQEHVDAILEEPVKPAPVIVAPQVARVAGLGEATTWSATVVDLAALVKWVAQDTGNRLGFLQAHRPTLNAAARKEKDKLAIPGVVASSSTGFRRRAE